MEADDGEGRKGDMEKTGEREGDVVEKGGLLWALSPLCLGEVCGLSVILQRRKKERKRLAEEIA